MKIGLMIATTAFCAAAFHAQAQVTPAQVWERLEQAVEAVPDAQLTIGTLLEGDDQYLATDVVYLSRNMSGPEPMTVRVSIPSITITDRGDGSSQLVYAEQSTATIEAGTDTRIDMTITSENLRYIISGVPERMNVAMSGDATTIALTELRTPNPALETTASIRLADVIGNTIVSASDTLIDGYQGDAAFSAMTLDINWTDGTEQTRGSVQGKMMDVAVRTALELDDPAALSEDIGQLFAGASKLDTSVEIAGTELQIDVDMGDNQQVKITYADQGTGFSTAFGDGTIGYETFANDLALSMLMTDAFPLPIDASLAQFATKFVMPVSANQDSPFEFDLILDKLMVSDLIWNMVDPAEVFQRAAASAEVQISGLGKWYFNIFDPEEASMIEPDQIPGEVKSVQIDALKLDALGLKADGTGAFTFDFDDMQTMPGTPRPEGQATLDVEGVNAFMDKLITMGIITPEDAMGARMAMAMFTQPGPVDDSLTTSVQITPDAQILINGQRIR